MQIGLVFLYLAFATGFLANAQETPDQKQTRLGRNRASSAIRLKKYDLALQLLRAMAENQDPWAEHQIGLLFATRTGCRRG